MRRPDPGRSRKRTARRHRNAPGVALVLALLLLCAAAVTADPVRSCDLGGGIVAGLYEDGSLVLRLGTDADVGTLLEISPLLPPAGPQRRSLYPDEPFRALFREGAPGGHRGFSALADDDGDGRVDEDRADGLDNDGDGAVDEDFAAVSDEMSVLEQRRGDRVARLETYHWLYPALRDVLFAVWRHETRDGAPRAEEIRLTLPEGDWRAQRLAWEAPLVAPSPAVAERIVFTAPLRHGEGRIWLGVSVLAPRAPAGGRVPRLEGESLVIPLDGDLALAVAAAPTLLQLRCRLAAAHAVRQGVRPDPSSPAQPWIVPALRSATAMKEPLPAVWRQRAGAGWALEIDVPAGFPPLIDPETLITALGRPGAPAEVAWAPDAGIAWSAVWPDASAERHPFRRPVNAPYPEGPGRLTFVWPDLAAPPETETIRGATVCGLGLEIAAQREAATVVVETASPGTALADRDRPPALSPALLDIYPNPTRDTAGLRYRIPRTLGEGFVWAGEPPAGFDLSAPVPYETGAPLVTLTIYTVAGHEIATVFAGSCAVGEYSATWNGLDETGRPVAAGTYFCKLQIDKWSVTKRVALLR